MGKGDANILSKQIRIDHSGTKEMISLSTGILVRLIAEGGMPKMTFQPNVAMPHFKPLPPLRPSFPRPRHLDGGEAFT